MHAKPPKDNSTIQYNKITYLLDGQQGFTKQPYPKIH